MSKIGNFYLKDGTQILTTPSKKEIVLRPKETKLFLIFSQGRGEFLKSELILKRLGSKQFTAKQKRSLDVYVCKMRKILSQDSNINIATISGAGYVVTDDGVPLMPIMKKDFTL